MGRFAKGKGCERTWVAATTTDVGCRSLARFSTCPGGRGGKERGARHERSSDWPRGAEPPAPEQCTTRTSINKTRFYLECAATLAVAWTSKRQPADATRSLTSKPEP